MPFLDPKVSALLHGVSQYRSTRFQGTNRTASMADFDTFPPGPRDASTPGTLFLSLKCALYMFSCQLAESCSISGHVPQRHDEAAPAVTKLSMACDLMVRLSILPVDRLSILLTFSSSLLNGPIGCNTFATPYL